MHFQIISFLKHSATAIYGALSDSEMKSKREDLYSYKYRLAGYSDAGKLHQGKDTLQVAMND